MTSSQALWALFAILCVQGVTASAVLLLGRRASALVRLLPYLVSTAAGVLLATACLDLLPEAVRNGAGIGMWSTLLISLLALFSLEALAHEQASHEVSPNTPSHVASHVHHESISGDQHGHIHYGRADRHTAAPLVLGSALHSAVDGVAIAAAFTAGPRPGWSAAAAVCLHELPHRLGDFSLLLHKGVEQRRAAQLAVASGAAAFVGGLAVVALGEHTQAAPWLLPVSAASFLYIALADLVPELQAQGRTRRLWWEVLCVLSGAALIAAMTRFPGE